LSIPTSNDLPKRTRTAIISILNGTLADLLDFHAHVKHAHWNVKGPQFISLHEHFDQLAERIDEHADDVAERITALGGIAEGDLRSVVKASRLKAAPSSAFAGMDAVAFLVESLAAVIKASRAAIDKTDDLEDACTADLYTAMTRDLDKRLWLLEAHLQAKS
jgi:starvation-inducible DNA-binding protein